MPNVEGPSGTFLYNLNLCNFETTQYYSKKWEKEYFEDTSILVFILPGLLQRRSQGGAWGRLPPLTDSGAPGF